MMAEQLGRQDRRSYEFCLDDRGRRPSREYRLSGLSRQLRAMGFRKLSARPRHRLEQAHRSAVENHVDRTPK